MTIFINLAFSYLAAAGFGIILNVPRKAINGCGCVGALGWGVYKTVFALHGGMVLSNLIAALMIGVSSIFIARFKKMPMILFNIPSLVPLVPGGQAYRAVQNFAFGNNNQAIVYLVQVTLIAGSIAMGFFLAELLARLYFGFRNGKK